MLKFLADENFNNDMRRGVLLLNPQIDIIRVQETSLVGAADPIILEWAAKEGRVLLTHDVNTMPGFAYDRVNAGLPMPGIIAVHEDTPVGQAIKDIHFLSEGGFDDDYEDQVVYIPLHW